MCHLGRNRKKGDMEGRSSAGSAENISELEARIAQLESELSDLRDENAQLRRDAYYDKLTGLYNRAMFDELLGQTWSEIQREEAETNTAGALSMLYMDLDNFKAVNDNYGHPVGDNVLRVLAQTIDSHTRDSDYACRIGGDEFIMALPDTDAEGAQEVANKLLVAFTVAESELGNHHARSGLSIGIGTHKIGDEPDKLLNEADTALLSAKRAGKGGVVHFDAIE